MRNLDKKRALWSENQIKAQNERRNILFAQKCQYELAHSLWSSASEMKSNKYGDRIPLDPSIRHNTHFCFLGKNNSRVLCIPPLERKPLWYSYHKTSVRFAHYSENRITMSFCLHRKLWYVIIKVQSRVRCWGADHFAKRKTVKRSGDAAEGIAGSGGAVLGKGLHQNHDRRDRKGGGHRTELVLPCFSQ